ncbi:FemAB family XrtA/PEP-CTERM system-associated protein [Hyphococcus sp. DH-69]|uniref:FemAB family XrtA/PEP-CTERM system-associated protein n=1 Tax=Hyphococcus formosus TaxID=3143534 RepID=UPI00398AF452
MPTAMTNSTEIHVSGQVDRSEWDSFVNNHPEASFFHLSGWSAIAHEIYNYAPVYITARRDNRLVGVLSLSHVKAPLTGRSLVSTAFSVGGGPLAIDQEALSRLLNAAEEVGTNRNVDYIELRSDFSADHWQDKSGTHAGFKAPIIKNEKEALAAIPRKRRAEVRKAIALAEAGDLVLDQRRNLDVFYRLYAHSLHRLGTPVFPKRFIANLVDEFRNHTEILTLTYRGDAVASLVNFYFGDTVLPYYIGANDAAREARAFDYLYWITMRRASEKGYSYFDFGRSKIDSGPYFYKKLWGFNPEPVRYRIKPIKADSIPNISPNNPKYAAFVKLWPKIPAPIVNRVGPMLAPNFP